MRVRKNRKQNNPKNPYRMNNYFKIDSEYGTEDDLREFIEAHRLLRYAGAARFGLPAYRPERADT